jgi:hypothetical protein
MILTYLPSLLELLVDFADEIGSALCETLAEEVDCIRPPPNDRLAVPLVDACPVVPSNEPRSGAALGRGDKPAEVTPLAEPRGSPTVDGGAVRWNRGLRR